MLLKILNVSASFLNKLRLTGGGPSYAKFGFHVRYTTSALLAYAESRTRTSTADNASPEPPPRDPDRPRGRPRNVENERRAAAESAT